MTRSRQPYDVSSTSTSRPGATSTPPTTTTAEGYLAPAGIDPSATVGITANLALDGVPRRALETERM
jgi:hypothetical protein